MTNPARPVAAATPFLKAGARRPRTACRTALLGIVVASLVSAPGIATAVSVPNPSLKTSPTVTENAAAALGVAVSAGGWINYTKLASKSLPLTNVKISTVIGKRVAGGGCEFGEPIPAASAGNLDYTEQIAMNPTSCAVKFLTGRLSETAATEFKAQIQAQLPTKAVKGAISSSMAASAKSARAGATAVAPAVRAPSKVAPAKSATAAAATPTYYKSAYSMSRWIDPVSIVITSQAVNLSWPLYGKGGTLSSSWPSYAFPYDGWSRSGPYFSGFRTLPGDTGWSVTASSTFVNRDFASVVYALMGLSGWFACGRHPTNKADFYHAVKTVGYRKGTRDTNASNTVSGACSNLVHLQSLADYGTWK